MRAAKKRVALGIVVVVLCVAATTYAYVRANAGVFVVPVTAMEPTIESGQTVRADMSAYETSDPQRWDVVVFRSPQVEGKTWIFRVVGLPGETISFKESGLLIDGQPAELPEYLRDIRYSALQSDSVTIDHPYTVPPSSYYVVGDNAAKANDSRVWGAVPSEDILGKYDEQ